MAVENSAETIGELTGRFDRAGLHRPMRVERYEAGTELIYDVTAVSPSRPARVRLVVDKFVGGGFAGQVYRVRLAEIDSPQGPIAGLEVGGRYAVKILLPPSNFARRFRDFIYKVGFQAPFSLQVTPAASRAGALWQKFIRRAAASRFGDERSVVDVLATFVDSTLGSCGEISEWVAGRTWRFEVDGRLSARRKWSVGQSGEGLGSPEYRAKKTFMADFVDLLHEMGAAELARQYEWWTCKSQPNALKRLDSESQPERGLTAVDFRAGLALLAFLPMSPGDLKLIGRGLARGSLVQFDRGDLDQLRAYVDARRDEFADMSDAMEELAAADRQYRDSQIDITHNHVRLLHSRALWSKILDSTVSGWRVANVTDDVCTGRLRSSRFGILIFAALGLLPSLSLAGAAGLFVAGLAGWGWSASLIVSIVALAVPLPVVATLAQKVWARADLRRHYAALLGGGGYIRRAIRAHVAERLIGWHRAGRVGAAKARTIAGQPWRFLLHLPFSLLPAGLHRFSTDAGFAREKAAYIFVRPVRLFFNPGAREQWLRDMVAEGRRNHMLTDADAERILSRIAEPFVQKYLKSLAVHVCTLPVTQIVSVAFAAIWVWTHPERSTAWAEGLAIIALFQVTPISPGSMARGLYVVYLVIRERNFRDYNIAVFLGFFKYVGYLAFPIQMAYRYPVLARFMAGHWATGAVHVVPVFGERGALLEHAVFDLFYNYPLTVRRRMGLLAEHRRGLRARSWHAVPIALAAVASLAAVSFACRWVYGTLPTIGDVWPATVLVPMALGAAVALGAGGASIAGRVKMTLGSAAVMVVGYVVVYGAMMAVPVGGLFEALWEPALWSTFIFGMLAVVAMLLVEINMPAPDEAAASEKPEEPERQNRPTDDGGVDRGDQVVQ